jgi:hypothetical protein
MATNDNAPTSDRTKTKIDRANDERDLDKALEGTFPASDPVTVGRATGDEEAAAPIGRRTPLLDVELIKRLARKLKRPANP